MNAKQGLKSNFRPSVKHTLLRKSWQSCKICIVCSSVYLSSHKNTIQHTCLLSADYTTLTILSGHRGHCINLFAMICTRHYENRLSSPHPRWLSQQKSQKLNGSWNTGVALLNRSHSPSNPVFYLGQYQLLQRMWKKCCSRQS